MGIFDGILGPIISGGLGFLGAQSTNQANVSSANAANTLNAEEAEKNRQFQTDMWHMSNADAWAMRGSQYQTAVGDMKAAGLNPMLAYSQGGAGTNQTAPMSGSTASAAGIPRRDNPGIAAAQSAAAASQTQANQSQIELNAAKEAEARAGAVQRLSSAGQLDALKDSTRQEMKTFDIRLQKLGFERELSAYDVIKAEGAQQRGWPDLTALSARAKELEARAKLYGLEVPEAVANAAAWTKLGMEGKLADYGTRQVGNVLGSAAQIRNMFRRGPIHNTYNTSTSNSHYNVDPSTGELR